MRGKHFSKKVSFVLILVLLTGLGTLVFGQEKTKTDKDKKMREEILSIYQSKGEKGLLDFVKKQGDKISNKFIVDFAEAGVNERKEKWLKVCEIMAEEKKDEKTLADVYYKMGTYFRYVTQYKNARDYYEKALPYYLKLNDSTGRGNVSMGIGIIHSLVGERDKALKMYDKALHFFVQSNDLTGQGNLYFYKGMIYVLGGDFSTAQKMFQKSLFFFEKIGNSQGLGNVYRAKGDVRLYSGNLPGASEMYEKALPFFEKVGDNGGQGDVYQRRGIILHYSGDNTNAIKMYKKALVFYKKTGNLLSIGHVYRSIGNIYLTTGDNSGALGMYEKALSFFEKGGEPIAQGQGYLGKGNVYSYMGDYSNAHKMYDKSLFFFRKVGEPIGQGNVYYRKGDIFLHTGDKLKGLESLEKALHFFNKAGEPRGQGNVYFRKGDIYLKAGAISHAIKMYDEALSFFQKASNPLGQSNVYSRKGEIYLARGRQSSGAEFLNKALLFFEKAKDPLGQGNIHLQKAKMYSDIFDYTRALEMCGKALPFFEKVEDPLSIGNVFKNKGDILLKAGRQAKALEVYEKALALYEKHGYIEAESYVLYKKATVLVKSAKQDEAMLLFEKSIGNLEKVRVQTAFSEMKRTFMEKAYGQYEETVLFMLDNKYHDKGFKYAEAMRSRVFLDRMSEGLVKLDKGVLPELKKKRDNLTAKLSIIGKEIHKNAGNKDEKKLPALKEQYHEVENEFEELLVKIRLKNPLYASVKYPKPVSLQTLQEEVLKKGELLLRYFTSPEKLYVFLVSKEKFKVIPLDVKEEEIKKTIHRYLTAMKEKNSREVGKYGWILYKTLFKPLEKKINKNREIIISPDGLLERIPFESFVIGETKAGRPIYLLEKHRIKYIQSASVLSVLREHYRRDSKTKNFIGFGDPVYDYENFRQGKPELGVPNPKKGDEIKEIHRGKYSREGGKLPRLKGSGPEVTIIADLFKKAGSNKSTVRLREQALEENAKLPEMKNYDYIHFSCHGILGENFQSLVLAQDIPGAEDDGYFTLNEIMNCEYNAELVVLSACRTGSGKMERGEGVTGLTRAVMYAGTPAVVASLWDVDDEAAKELMIHFYRNLLENDMDKTEALRQAKLHLLKNSNYASPFFWSAFVMYGE